MLLMSMNCLNISDVLESSKLGLLSHWPTTLGKCNFFVYIYFVKLSSKACSDAQLFYITIEPKKFTTVHCKDLIAVEVGMERYGWPINWIDKKVF